MQAIIFHQQLREAEAPRAGRHVHGLVGVGTGVQSGAPAEELAAPRPTSIDVLLTRRQARVEDQGLAQVWTAGGSIFGHAMWQPPVEVEIAGRSMEALVLFDDLLQEVDAKGFDANQAKHLRAVKRSLDSTRQRGNKLFR